MTTTLGCFGSVLYHDPAGRRCNACPFKTDCAQEVVENKEKLKTWYTALSSDKQDKLKGKLLGIEPKARRTRAATATASATTTHEPRLIGSNGKALVNAKPKEFVQKWTDKGIDFMAYKRGVNGFDVCGNKFAKVAMQFMMDEKSITKDRLIDHLVSELKWGLGTAASHANIILDAFEYLGICKRSGVGMHDAITLE